MTIYGINYNLIEYLILILLWKGAKNMSSKNFTFIYKILVGFLVSCILFLLLKIFHISITTVTTIFVGTYLQAIPFLFMGILLSSAIQVFVSSDLIERVFPKNLTLGMLFGVLGGFCLPVCDCVSIPVFRSLVKKGVPLPAAVVFMTAAPVINPVVMLSTYHAYNGNVKVVLARVILGIVCSLLIGFCFAKEKHSILLDSNHIHTCSCGCHNHNHCHESNHSHIERHNKLKEFIAHSKDEFFEIGKYLIIGIGVSTLFQIILGNNLVLKEKFNLPISLLVMMVLAFLLSLCSSSDAIVSKGLGANFPFGASMGFMVFGPMMDIKNIILMSNLFSKKFIFKLIFLSFSICFAVVYMASVLGLEVIL